MTKDIETCSMTLIMDGKHTTIHAKKDQTILETAEASNIEAPHACRKGLCTKCMAVLSEGEVAMEDTTKLNEEQLAERKILTCISRPTTHTIVVNYDF